MANLSKTKTLFGITSPRTIEKVIPEIYLLCSNFSGMRWKGNSSVQSKYFQKLYNSEFYEGDKYPKDPAFAARDRITRAPKSLGFVDLYPVIRITKAGEALLEGKRKDEIFTKQLLKFQLPSPYHMQSKICNFYVKPYLELLRLINDLDGLSKTEIALFFLQLVNISKYEEIVNKISSFRFKRKKNKQSWKRVVADIFKDEILSIYSDEIKNQKLNIRENKGASLKKFISTKRANMKDYADAFVRYIHSTELVTFEKKTYRLIISSQKREEVEFILKNIQREPIEFSTLKVFKCYLFDPSAISLLSDDKNLLINKLKSLGVNKINKKLDVETLKDFLDDAINKVKNENIEKKKYELKNYNEYDDIISVFHQIKKRENPDPALFLEWNVWRSFVMLNYANRVDGNFSIDIDGMPLNTAPGNMADIEIEFDDFAIIGEVTMSSGATQFKMEGDSVPRHYGEFKRKIKKNTYCLFVAPNINDGTKAFFFNLNKGYTKLYGGATKILPISLDKFIEFVSVGVRNKFSDPTKLHIWLENQWINNRKSKNEIIWNNKIEESILKWAS